MPVLAGLDKTYEGVMKIHSEFTRPGLEKAIKGHTGRITQIPPKRSAVARRERIRNVLSLEILSIRGQSVSFRTTTQAGTYIRKLSHDIGQSMGQGAHMASLRRIGIGPFKIEEAVSMDRFRKGPKKCLIPLEEALGRTGFPLIPANKENIRKLSNGLALDSKALKIPRKIPELFGISDSQGRLLVLARLESGKVKPERVLLLNRNI
jgi:tRNA U55 pseudouridine synthase TruB